MRIPDESDRVADLAAAAYAGPRDGRDAALQLLYQFDASIPPACEAAVWQSGNPAAAVTAAVEKHRENRQATIAYRKVNGLPVEDE